MALMLILLPFRPNTGVPSDLVLPNWARMLVPIPPTGTSDAVLQPLNVLVEDVDMNEVTLWRLLQISLTLV